MTDCKLVVKNLRKNLSGYLIYFITITLSISLFYAFQALPQQPAFVGLSQTKRFLFQQVEVYVSALSVGVGAVLAFLLTYANRFLLKRRKKELGVYLLLGMKKLRVSLIFTGETALAGLLALGAGLILGVAFSQVLSAAALRLFAVPLENFRFVFSAPALQKTVLCFACIFLLMILMNARALAQARLIDLFQAGRKNEPERRAKPALQAVEAAAAVAMLAVCALLLEKNGLQPAPGQTYLQTCGVLAVAGTLLLFRAGAGLWLWAAQKKESFWYRGLNLFLARQLSARIRSGCVVLTAVCALLTVSLCAISTGVSMGLAVNDLARQDAPYDLEILSTRLEVDGDGDIAAELLKYGADVYACAKDMAQLSIRDPELSYAELFAGQRLELWDIDATLPQSNVPTVSISEFNRALALQGKAPYTLEEGQYLLNCNYKGTRAYVEAAAKAGAPLTVGGVTLRPAQSTPLGECYYMNSIGNNDRGTLVVPDRVAQTLPKGYNVLAVLYRDGADTAALLDALRPIGLDDAHGYRYAEKAMMYDMYYGTNALLSLMCCYVGLIFLLACAALLALKQLTETADNIYRYGVLQKLGADGGAVTRGVCWQAGVFFAAPLAVAGVYSVYLTAKLVRLVETFMNLHITAHMGATVLLYLVVYGGYYLATVCSCCAVVRERRAKL